MFWESEKQEKENDKAGAQLSTLLEELRHKYLLRRFLFLCAAGNILAWLLDLLMPEAVNRIFGWIFAVSDKIGASVLGFPFGFALFTAYCLCCLKMPDVEENKTLQSDMISSFNYQADSMRRWFVWLFSITVGIVNVALLVLANLYLNDQL